MAYARPGEGSDLYVWSDGEHVHCEAEGKVYSTQCKREMIEHLMMHRRRGQEVPESALERLWAEHAGLPYETDVERSLRALRGL